MLLAHSATHDASHRQPALLPSGGCWPPACSPLGCCRRGLHWQTVSLTQEPSGLAVSGRISQLPDEPHHAEAVHAASWMWRGLSHNYRVRQRLGWSQLRDLLIQVGAGAWVGRGGEPALLCSCGRA